MAQKEQCSAALYQTHCYRVCMYAKALFVHRKTPKKAEDTAAPYNRGLKEQEASKHQGTTKPHLPPKCQILTVNWLEREEQNKMKGFYSSPRQWGRCAVAWLQQGRDRGTAAEPENAAPSPPHLGSLTSLVLTTRCCGNQTASDKATLNKSNMWENAIRPWEKLIFYTKNKYNFG